MSKKKQFDISIDHPMLKSAKESFDYCLRVAIEKAIATGSDEGSATLKISFEIFSTMDEHGEINRTPEMKYKAGYSVPMKESLDATITEKSKLVRDPEVGFMLINGQISMDELMAEDSEG